MTKELEQEARDYSRGLKTHIEMVAAYQAYIAGRTKSEGLIETYESHRLKYVDHIESLKAQLKSLRNSTIDECYAGILKIVDADFGCSIGEVNECLNALKK